MSANSGLMEKELGSINTTIRWPSRDPYDVGDQLTDEEISKKVNALKKKALNKKVFYDIARHRLYRWLKLNMKNCAIESYNQDHGIVYFVVGKNEAVVEEYVRNFIGS